MHFTIASLILFFAKVNKRHLVFSIALLYKNGAVSIVKLRLARCKTQSVAVLQDTASYRRYMQEY